LIADPAKLVFDSDPSWLPSIFARRVVHDDDYRIFGYFRDQDSLVLDIGANYGYSVASMFAAGCQSCVLSFDPIAPLAACLAEVVRLNPGRCDYRMAALGAGEGIQRFVMPVINNRGITALTTADTQPHLESLAESLCLYKTRHMAGEPFSSLTFHTFAAPVQTLDAALRSGGPFEVPTNSIVAAKIDTEGTEAAVLAGARDTLTAHRPLILIEGANRQPSVRAILQGAGYEFADRGDDRLSLSADISMRPNGFFVHRSRLDEYRACGLLCA
jgi:FkbM family methyltransferase